MVATASIELQKTDETCQTVCFLVWWMLLDKEPIEICCAFRVCDVLREDHVLACLFQDLLYGIPQVAALKL